MKTISPKTCRCARCRRHNSVYNETDICRACQKRRAIEAAPKYYAKYNTPFRLGSPYNMNGEWKGAV